MNLKFNAQRSELQAYYFPDQGKRSAEFAEKCFKILDSKYDKNMTVTEQKLLQYRVIVDEFEPKIFENCPFFYETDVLSPMSDGYRKSRETKKPQANGWVYFKNKHLFRDFDPELWEHRTRGADELLYLICGAYNDDAQHFNFNNRPILERGLRGVYEDAEAELRKAETGSEKEFLRGVCGGMLELRRMAEKFAKKAEEMLMDHPENENFRLIAKTAARVPWEAPRTLYEALTTLAFMRKAVGSLEGIAPNTFGRIDFDLYRFYEDDIKAGRLTRDGAYELICRFLITWDSHYDHDIKMVGYSDHELENTYVLGGCDENGVPVYNELTKLFLSASIDEKIIYPKVKCRFSASSPKEYLVEMTRPLLTGTSTFLYQNDDATIPGLLLLGIPLSEAFDYIVSGCWDISTYQEKHDCGNYLNLLKPFEYALHRRFDKMEYVGIDFLTFDDADSFEELYARVLRNCEILLRDRISLAARGGHIFETVDALPIFSSTLNDCIKNHADYRCSGSRYRDDQYYFFGLPDIVDSLLAIKKLVYDDKKYTLSEMLDAVRNNWEGAEDIHRDALACHGWGDGNEDSCALARRFNYDLFAVCDRLTGSYGGKVRFVHLTYTEIRFWGEKTLATPNGRKNGEYFSQGLTPSRLKRIPCVNDVVNSFAALDPACMINNVVNIILPPTNISSEYLCAFMRVCAGTAMQCMQLNCTSREQLLDAQKHPEKYPDLIVRVTGFSAKFTSLSKEWQDEVISRNFYE